MSEMKSFVLRNLITVALLYAVWRGSRLALVIVLALESLALEAAAFLIRRYREEAEMMDQAIV